MNLPINTAKMSKSFLEMPPWAIMAPESMNRGMARILMVSRPDTTARSI